MMASTGNGDPLTANGREVLVKRYLRKDEEGRPIETIDEMFMRVAQNVAAAHADAMGDEGEVYYAVARYFDVMRSLRFLPNTPTFTGAGTPLKQLAACFVLPVDDDIGKDSKNGIFSTLRNAVLIQQSGGGVGFSFSRLRQKGDRVKTSAGVASGPVSFMRVYDAAFGAVAQGGCLVADTLVFTEEGLLRMDELVDFRRSKPGQWTPLHVVVPTQYGPKETKRGYYNGSFPVATVHTDCGMSLTGTFNHRVMLDGNIWKELKDLVAGDKLLMATNQFNGKEFPVFPGVVPAECNCEAAYVLGCMSAGFLSRQHKTGWVTFITWKDDAVASNMIACRMAIMAEAGVPCAFRESPKWGTMELYIEGLTEMGPIDKHVPRAIRANSRRVIGAYLRGVFEIRGLASPNMVPSVAMENKTLAMEIATLLIGLGCPVNVSSNLGENATTVTVLSDVGLYAWREWVGCDDGSRLSRCASRHFAVSPGKWSGKWTTAVTGITHSAAPVPTGDIEVSDVHHYIANGFVTHNSRRGANMGTLRVDHPDILEFIKCKTGEGALSNFNISVGVTDAFMRKMVSGEPYSLVSPRTGQDVAKIDSKTVMDAIIESAHLNGEPGLLFLDRLNETNPLPHLYSIETTNPCGEQALGPYESCVLGSVNLAVHFKPDGRTFDWEGLADTVRLGVKFLDDVVTANGYVPSVPELAEAAWRGRRIGLGFMGLADVLFRVGAAYGEVDGMVWAAQIAEWIQYHAMGASVELAKARGTFPAIVGSIYDPGNLRWSPPTDVGRVVPELSAMAPVGGRPAVDWGILVEAIRNHGLRNAALTTVAPTGTIGTVAGVEGYGIEPAFGLSYTRYVLLATGKRAPLRYASKLFLSSLAAHGIEECDPVVEKVLESGTCAGVAGVPPEVARVFVTAGDVPPKGHVMMQAVVQYYFSNSISKTINLPESATRDDVRTAYELAWRLGCRGITVYRTNSRHDVVIYSGSGNAQK